ncbi:MAG: 6-bladed beta-propeller [Gemmatimonadaceae bacterium]|nr:6-bladed beta-propeller [Gemmatimonadaceae bacterium]
MPHLDRASTVPVARLLIALAAIASPGRAQGADTVRLPLRWEITEQTSAVAESLGVLSGIAVDKAGTVYVSDRGAVRVWVFDANGRSQRGIGRKGQGPGEFQSPTGVAVGPDGRLWVRDVVRVSRFAADPATGRLTRFEASFNGPAMSDWMSDRATRFRTDGAMLFPEFNVMYRQRPAPRTGRYRAIAPDGTERDSIDVPTFPNAPATTARVQVDANSGRMLRGLNHVPFAPIPVWDVTPRGTVLVGDATAYVIRELDRTGKVLREFRRSVPPLRIPAAERRDSTAALKARVDSLQYPRAQVEGVPPEVWALRLPEVYPAYAAVYAGADGRVWVRRWAPEGHARSVFDVFEADGRFRTTVVLPRAIALLPTPWLSLDGIAAIGIDAETGAHTVLRFGPAVAR